MLANRPQGYFERLARPSGGEKIAAGDHNSLGLDGDGLAAAFQELAADVKRQFGLELTNLAAGGFSAMMHGYIVVDKDDKLLVPFRTWRNNITGQACAELSPLLDFAVLISQFLTNPLVDLGGGWLALAFMPVNNLASLSVLLLKGSLMTWKKLTGVSLVR